MAPKQKKAIKNNKHQSLKPDLLRLSKDWLLANLPLVTAFVIGLLASLANSLPIWIFPSHPDWLRVLSIILNSASLWLSLAFWAAHQAPNQPTATRRAMASLALLLTGYYLITILWGGRQLIEPADLILTTIYWVAFALAAALVFGRLGWLYRQAGWPLYLLSLTFIAEATHRLWLSRAYWSQDQLHTGSWVLIIIFAIILALAQHSKGKKPLLTGRNQPQLNAKP